MSHVLRVGTAVLLLLPASSILAQAAARQATVPLVIAQNRPYIEVSFRRADGSMRKARFLLDTGGGGFLISEPLARDIGLEWGSTSREEGQEFGLVKNTPTVTVGGFPLELNPSRVLVLIGTSHLSGFAGKPEGMIPAHVLSRYHIVFDYPKATFTVAMPGVLTPRGDEMSMPVSRLGFPRTEIQVDGSSYGLLLDWRVFHDGI